MKINKYLFFLIVLILFTGVSAAYFLKEDISNTFPSEKELTELVEHTMSDYPSDEIQITNAEIVASFKENNRHVVLANIYQMGFIPKEGIFELGSGAMFPVEIHFTEDENSLEMSDIIYPLDGSEFSNSIQKMSRNNVLWYKALMDSQNSYHKVYNSIILKLKNHLDENEISGYNHLIDQIPGYESNIVLLRNLKNEPDGNIGITKRYVYDNAKKEIGKVNWPHYKGIMYNEATGIVIETIFDEFPVD